MPISRRRPARRPVAILGALTVAAAPLTLAPGATAAPAGDALVISEFYGGGGNSGAELTHDFVELYNPTDAPVSVAGWSVQYRSAAGTGAGQVTELTGEVPAGGYYLIRQAEGNGGSTALPSPDATGSTAMAGRGGQVWLASTTEALTPPAGDATGADQVIDLVGAASSASTYESAPVAEGPDNTTSVNRTGGGDTDDNSADFTVAAPTPTNAAGETPGEDDDGGSGGEPVTASIAEVQGGGDASPLAGETVTVTGVVTADYATGGFNGFYVQDPEGDPNDDRSDAVFVYGDHARAEVGRSVEVTGSVSEYRGLTEITPEDGGVVELTDPLGDVAPLEVPWSELGSEEQKEAHEGELIAPSGPFTVTDNYDTNFYGSIGLAAGTQPLPTPTDVADPHDEAAIAAVEAENASRRITLDDGASINFNASNNTDIPLPYLTPENPVRVGSRATFHQPVVLEYRYDAWNVQPTVPVTDDGSDVVTFSGSRAQHAEPADVGSDLTLATFNVLNYFPTTGEEYERLTGESCTYHTDRHGEPVGVNRCGEEGPRGAADAEDLARQETKIVNAITSMDASIVSLEELENSAKFGKDRDAAIGTLVEALNASAGAGTWAYAPSPAAEDLPPLENQDVIRTGFIYQPEDVELVGGSRVLTGSEAFGNARKPVIQGFKAAGSESEDAFLVSANHFKSKGSGVDDGTGQGNANPSRIAQAEALVDFADDVSADTGIESVFLAGDFNAYSQEDPVRIIERAGYLNLNHELNGGEPTYNYDGMVGSLDHVFANDAAAELVTGVDVWQINAPEQVGFEYSRYNYNATLLYDESVFRASDHDPAIVGLDLSDAPTAPEWDASETYVAQDRVSHDGAVWLASWWTRGQEPGSSPWGPWQEIETSGDGTAVWTESRIFEAGDVVVHDGTRYEAKWWTRNQEPGDPYGPWRPLE